MRFIIEDGDLGLRDFEMALPPDTGTSNGHSPPVFHRPFSPRGKCRCARVAPVDDSRQLDFFARIARRWRGVFAIALALLVLAPSPARAWDPERIVRSAQRYGPLAVAGAQALQQAVAPVLGKDEATQIRVVNDFYNRRIAYKEDIDNWGELDYWASPLEALSKNAGDCEDYAIAKYFTLVALGMPHEKLRMVYVRATMPGPPLTVVPHMVLAYYAQPQAEPLVLDNLRPEIRPAGERSDLTPVFSFNAESLWQGVGSIRANGDPLTRLSRWRDVLVKSEQDGFK
jgi:predicted transglutaminase-like cysteine proteinase